MSLRSWFKKRFTREKEKSYVTKPKKELPKRKEKLPKITYRQEMVSDGKSDKLYGPYWYGYFRKDGKLHKRYIGKQRNEIKPK